MRQSSSAVRVLFLLPIVFVAAACGFAEEQQPGTPMPAGMIQWDRSPSSIVFSADVLGGQDDISSLSEVPLCTIYGDNRVVWVNELDAFHVEILYDHLTDGAVSDFVSYLTVEERIYTFEALASEQETDGIAPGIAPVVETVTLNVNGQTHSADGFSGWDNEWFSRVLRSCKRISQSPILFEPTDAWLTIVPSEYSIQAPTINWDTQETSLRLQDLANNGEPHWISGRDVVTFWTYLNAMPSSLRFVEEGQYYRAALQIPGISRISPPPA